VVVDGGVVAVVVVGTSAVEISASVSICAMPHDDIARSR
jgi:hypothetical protein